MAHLILPSRRIAQPQGAVEIDWSNPITRGLIFACEGDGPTNYARQTMRDALGAGVTAGIGPHGRTMNFSGEQANGACIWPSTEMFGATESTIELMFFNSAGSSHVFNQWSSDTNHWLLQINSGTGVVWVPAEDNSGSRRRWDGSSVFSVGAWQHVIASWRGGSDYSFVVNGAKKTLSVVNATATSIRTTGTTLSPIQLGVCRYGYALTGAIAFARAWRRGLLDSEIDSILANSSQIFKKHITRIYFDVGAGGMPTLSSLIASNLTSSSSRLTVN